MIRTKLRERLDEQVAKYSSWSYEQFYKLSETISEYYGEPGTKDFYQVTVYVLERERDYVHIGISVDDGKGRFGLITPLTTTIIIHKPTSGNEHGSETGSGSIG